MKLTSLKLNRHLIKEPSQEDQTKGAVYNSVNPIQKSGTKDVEKRGTSNNNTQEDGAENILTGTVITACLIQTSALPSRIEMAGNDLTFYDNSFLNTDGQVVGDTAKLIFTHDNNSNEGFIIEKRGSFNDTYDNVLSWYASPAKEGRKNWMFIGREGFGTSTDRNLNHMELTVDGRSSVTGTTTEGVLALRLSSDQVLTSSEVTLFQISTLAPSNTGVGANLFGTGDGSASDLGYGAVGYVDSGSLAITAAVEANKDGIILTGVPTSSAGLPSGAIWSNGGVLTIV